MRAIVIEDLRMWLDMWQGAATSKGWSVAVHGWFSSRG